MPAWFHPPVWVHGAAGVAGVISVFLILRDAFETIILPRRLTGRFRFTRLYYRVGWPVWAFAWKRVKTRTRRETGLSIFGPFSMLCLFGLWAVGLMFAFALLYWSLGSPLRSTEAIVGFGMDLYLSGVTLLTLGIGAAVPHTTLSRILAVFEGGLGLGFVAVIISYLPVLYTGFSNREANISMLDGRAGSPPTASELLRRHANDRDELTGYLGEWERWSAQLLEAHISYPVLGYFRSQHVNQSWLAALTTLLDSCAFLMAAGEEECTRQAQFTFAMARHAVVDLAQIFIRALPEKVYERLPEQELARMCALLGEAGMPVVMDERRTQRLTRLRRLYEPHIQGIAQMLVLELPAWVGNPEILDNWQRSPWDRAASAEIGRLERTLPEQHF